ncbi:hypothetical protein ACFY0R_36850 [Streptomyces sp. NPDC001633]|uniref:hypothetical protein n=1 Tax=Streptomyces sp. NPDC001633 TaxID=3364595 RepID=UPI0036860CCC
MLPIPGPPMGGPPPGGAAGTTRIEEPASLKRAAHGANELAGDVRMAGTRAEDATRAAADSLKGQNWSGSLGAALNQVVDSWRSQTTALVNRCRSLHDRCAATADNYQQAESANERTMMSVRRPESSPFG